MSWPCHLLNTILPWTRLLYYSLAMNHSTSTSNCNNCHRNVHRHYLMIPSRACWVTLTRTDVQIHTDVSQGRRAQMELQKHVCQHIRILRSEIGILLIWQQCYIEIQLPFFPNLLTQEIFGNSFNDRRRRSSPRHIPILRAQNKKQRFIYSTSKDRFPYYRQ